AGLGLEPRDTGGHRGPPFPDLAELGREFGVVDPHQRLALIDDGAFLNEDVADNAAFEGLYDLSLARRHDAAIAALDLVKHGEMRPDHKRHEQGEEGLQQHARRSRRANCRGRTDVIRKGKIRRWHWVSGPGLRVARYWVVARSRPERSRACPAAAPAPCLAARLRPGGHCRTATGGRPCRAAKDDAWR